jgi:hypothetical protein
MNSYQAASKDHQKAKEEGKGRKGSAQRLAWLYMHVRNMRIDTQALPASLRRGCQSIRDAVAEALDYGQVRKRCAKLEQCLHVEEGLTNENPLDKLTQTRRGDRHGASEPEPETAPAAPVSGPDGDEGSILFIGLASRLDALVEAHEALEEAARTSTGSAALADVAHFWKEAKEKIHGAL